MQPQDKDLRAVLDERTVITAMAQIVEVLDPAENF